MKRAYLLFCLFCLSCGEPYPPILDAGPVEGGADGGGAGVDAGFHDAGSVDAGPVDAGADDAGTIDGGALDAGSSDGGCGDVGRECGGGCPAGMSCTAAGTTNFCRPSRPMCGGYAGTLCSADAPLCMYPNGSSGGICLTSAEKACICPRVGIFLSGCW